MKHELAKIGRNTVVEFIHHASNVPAKIDTGADSSSVWASNIFVDETNRLHYTLFDKQSPHYTGKEIVTQDFKVGLITSSTGHQQIRYRVKFSIRLEGRRIVATFSLANRSKNIFPVLIGRRTLAGKFLVDVSIHHNFPQNETEPKGLNSELQKNPYEFYKKYHGKSDIE